MPIEIKEIKDIRKKLGLTQFQLANRSGVSQSLIAKIEAGKLDPTYSKSMKIITTLHELSHKKELKANQLMSQRIVSILPSATIRQAISRMKKNSFSQLPVISDHKVLGMLSESTILDAMMEEKGQIVEDIMESPPPIVSYDTSISVLTDMAKFFQMILVSKKGRLVGVITKTDLLSKMYSS